MTLIWTDKKTVLKIGKKYYRCGDTVPVDVLSKDRIELFKSLKQIEEVTQEKIVGKPKAKPKAKKSAPKKSTKKTPVKKVNNGGDDDESADNSPKE